MCAVVWPNGDEFETKPVFGKWRPLFWEGVALKGF